MAVLEEMLELDERPLVVRIAESVEVHEVVHRAVGQVVRAHGRQ